MGSGCAYAVTARRDDGELIVRNLRSVTGVQAPARHRSAVHAGRQVRDLHDRAVQGGRGARATAEPWPWRARRRRRREPFDRLRASRARPKAVAAISVDRNLAPASASCRSPTAGHDGRQSRQLQAAGGIEYLARVLQGDRRRRRRWRRPRRTRRARRRCATSRRARRRRGGGGAERARAQAARLRSDPPQPGDRRRGHHPRSHRVRLEQEGLAARLCGLVQRRGEGRRVRATAARRHRHDAALRQGTLPQHRLRRSRAADRLPQRPGGVREAGRAVSRSTTGRARRSRRRPSSCRHRRQACRRGWSSPKTARRASRATARGSSSGPLPRRRPPPDPNATTPEPIAVDLWSTKDPWIQPMQRVRADDERTRNYRAVYHLADKKFVQLATPDLPTSIPATISLAPIGTSDLAYRHGGVLGPDLQRLLPARPQDRQAEADPRSTGARSGHVDVAGRASTSCTSTRQTGHWFTYRVVRRRAREPDRTHSRTCASSRKNTTRRIRPDRTASADGPTATRRSCSTTSSTSGKSSRTAAAPRNITGGEGRKAQDRVPLPLDGSGGAGRAGEQAAAAVGDRRSNPRDRLLPAAEPDGDHRARRRS